MNLRTIMLSILGLSSISYTDSFNPLPKSIALKATNLLNGYRRSVGASDMHLVHYDFETQKQLDAIIRNKGASWLFGNYTGPLPDFGVIIQNINGYYISTQLGMSPDFGIGWHDTCNSLGPDCIIKNFKFRIAQSTKNCIRYSLCDDSPDSYNRYRSCETNLPWRGSGHPCSYAWVYLPPMLTASITKIACAVLDVPGWKPPNRQLNSYWCYTNGVTPNSEQPYKIGPPCGDCPPKSKCINRLCD